MNQKELLTDSAMCIIGSLMKKHNILLQYVERNKIGANAFCFMYNSGFLILIDEALPIRLLSLVVLHEIGHIELGYLGPKYQSKYIKKAEAKCNRFAIKSLRNALGYTYYHLLLLSYLNEHVFFKYYLKQNTIDIDEDFWRKSI